MADRDEYAHLPVDVRPIAALGNEDRIAHIRAERWIQHAAAERALGYLQEAFDQPARKRMENVLLLGESDQATLCPPPYIIAGSAFVGEGRLGSGDGHGWPPRAPRVGPGRLAR